MVVTEISQDFPMDLSQGTGRTPGLHLSDIYGDLEEVLFSPRKTDNKLWMQVGFLWEELLTMAFKSSLGVRPGEVTLDGVIGSPDGINYTDGYVEEFKSTWKSAKRPLESIWKYMVQTMGYCKMVGMTVVRFRVLYINGDYSYQGPIYKDSFVVFERQEIDNNWNMLISHAKSKGWL